MGPGLALLLGLVSTLEERTQAHNGSLSQACVWAVPGAVLPLDASGSIFCRVPSGVTSLRLYHGVLGGIWYDKDVEGTQDVLQFSLPRVTQNDAGIYSCGYWKQGTWSRCSESLELVVTGVYRDQPSLTAHPAGQVASGGNVTLWCQPVQRYDTYILCRGVASFPQDCSHQNHSSFLISPGRMDQNETYTCYGSHNGNPQLWSLPSHPLVISVTFDFILRQEKSSSWSISVPDNTTENIIRLSLGILILFVVGAVMLDAWKGRNGL